ncbi:MAG: hypothetical protein HN729_02000 [Candidatus Marinimicrobia bacterium]|nr:hypothetical protein [Candidatus Neomarinimicrobiota bacterium]MBT3634881.1 hypothetical protein [Candidatus Neomarinimicrobiota bacterium]MBT3682757.1 hypothetical protein [Candidatus Neomarinimicrobiota bacterium]MBT3759588.1 hypothetical protein [Candidatus Neomarinimicrobiota bacterium]MBT3894540.1 hypothetical protein [Candidatus Neomarinimicrobiota bacterium]
MAESSLKKIDDKEILTKFSKKIVDRGMSVPAILFLETVKYVSFIGSQMLVFFGPIITAFVRSEPYYRITELLEDRKNIEFIMTEIERLEAEHKQTGRV